MNGDGLRALVGGVLLVHGLGHGGALGALLWIRALPNTPTGGWLAARSWIVPNGPDLTAAAMAIWTIVMLGFVAAALSFWGILVPGDLWRPLAIGSAVVSLAGLVVLFGTWPAFNWTAALVVNVAVLVTQLVTHWPPRELFGN